MDAEEFVDTVEAETATELDRLGSSKLLIALTGADLDADAVLRVAATSEHAARETFRQWADTEPDATARAAFDETAAQEADHYERVVAELDGEFEPPEAVDALHAYLRGLDDAVERAAAGLVGRGLVSARAHVQLVGFFVNDADRARADLFRDLRADTEAGVDRGADVLAAVAADADRERAEDAAVTAVETAYGEYADALDDLGLDPRPVC